MAENKWQNIFSLETKCNSKWGKNKQQQQQQKT